MFAPVLQHTRSHALNDSRLLYVALTGFGLVDLAEASPVQFNDGESYAEQIIDVLFPNNPAAGIDPLLCVGWGGGTSFKTKRRAEWRGHLHLLEFIVPSPMVSELGRTDDGRLSQHTLEATGRRVYQVVEFDFKNPIAAKWVVQWLESGFTVGDISAALLWHLADLMPLVCVTFSGGESLHGWFNLFKPNRSRSIRIPHRSGPARR